MPRSRRRNGLTAQKNPRSIEAGIEHGDIDPEMHAIMVDDRTRAVLEAFRILGKTFSPLVPCSEEDRLDLCSFLRTRLDALCDKIMQTTAEAEPVFSLLDRLAARQGRNRQETE